MAKPIFLHVGAHRTGTSSFQMCLALNRPALEASGHDVAYPGRDGAPGGDLRLALSGDGAFGRVKRRLIQHSPGRGRGLVMSEENIPGQMFPLFRGRFYPQAEERLATLAAAASAVDAHFARVLIVVRRYDSHFASAYRKRAEEHPINPFAKLAPRCLMKRHAGWPELVQTIQKTLCPQELVVVDYSNRGSSCAMLKALVPAVPGALQEPKQALNTSATDGALAVLQARYHAGEEPDAEQRAQVIRDHANARDDTGFAAFSDNETKILSERYSEHLDRISALPGVTLVR